MIWPHSNQNILEKDDTTELRQYLWAKRQPLISNV